MNDIEQILGELLDEIMPTIQAADSTGAAIVRVLKDKKIVSEDELAPYLEQAANASSVKQRAARLRVERLFTSAMKSLQNAAENSARKVAQERLGGEKAERSGEGRAVNHEAQRAQDDKRAQDAPPSESDQEVSKSKSEESKAAGTRSEKPGDDTAPPANSQPEKPAAQEKKAQTAPASGENAA